MGCRKLEEKLASAYQWYGELIGRRPLAFLLAPLIFTLLVGPGLVLLKYDEDIVLLFTPYSAPSRHEQIIARQFSHTLAPEERNSSSDFAYPLTSDEPYVDMWFFLQVSSRANIMTQETWTLVSEFVHDVYENFTCHVDEWIDESPVYKQSNHEQYTLQYIRDFCNSTRGCVQIDTMVDRVRDLLNSTKYGANKKVQLTYPVMRVWDRPFNWGQYIFGAKYDNESGKLESANVLMLYFQFQGSSDPRAQRATTECIRQLTHYTLAWNGEMQKSRSDLNFLPYNEPYISDEATRLRKYTLPCMVVCVFLIFAFVAATSFQKEFKVLSIGGAGMGVLTVGLSLLASTGVLCLCGFHINFVILIAPFLVLCVGIDNDFLITSAWRQTADGRSSVERRLGRAFADCGPSLTITSINDILCFGVGYLSETPAVADFCLYTCVTLAFRFIFQLTFFASVTAYIGKREAIMEERKREKSNPTPVFCPTVTASSMDADPLPKKCALTPTFLIDFTDLHIIERVKKENQRIYEFFRFKYANFLMRKPVRFTAAVLFVIYICLAVIGASRWRIEISPRKLFFDDSPLQLLCHNGEEYVHKQAVVGRVYVTNPPDFRNKSNVEQFLRFVSDLENIDSENNVRNFSVPRTDTTDLWLRQYVDFLQYIGPSDSDSDENSYSADFYDYLPPFLQSSDYNRYVTDIRFRKNLTDPSARPDLDKFQFVVTYFRPPQHPYSYEDHVKIMLRWREICSSSNYSEYEALVFDNFNMNAYYDQRLTLAPTCLQTMGIALLSMSVVTALLMPDIRSMFFICLSFLSVDVGVVAGLNVWYSDLDPTSLAFVLMTIGFSVYYTARVCYSFQVCPRSMSSSEKMQRTMETVGWPIVQGALATVLGFLPVTILQSYLVRVFCKTTLLVVTIGLLHGLLFMPVMMTAFDKKSPPKRDEIKCRSRNSSNDEHSPDTLSEYSTEH